MFKTGTPVFDDSFSALLIIAVTFVIYFISFFLIKKWARRKRSVLPHLLEKYIYYPGLAITFALSLFIIEPFLESYVRPKFFDVSGHFLQIILIALTGFLLMRIITVVRKLIISHYEAEDPGNFGARKAKTQFQLLQRVFNFMIVLATLSIILMTFKSIRSIGNSLLASAGIVGLVLGFAAQKSLGTIFAGIQIAVAQPIRIDDIVVVDGEFGTIGEITLTYVVINVWDGRRKVVPINYFIEKSFENWTRLTTELIGKVKIQADYSLPVEKVRAEFMKWVKASEFWDKRTAALIISAANDKTIELRATMSAKNADDAWQLECLIREKLITYINENFPHALPKGRSQNITGGPTPS